MLLDAPRRRSTTTHTVAVYAFDGMSPFELGCVVEVFGLPRPELGVPWYELKVCAETRTPLRAVGGFTMATEYDLDDFAGDIAEAVHLFEESERIAQKRPRVSQQGQGARYMRG